MKKNKIANIIRNKFFFNLLNYLMLDDRVELLLVHPVPVILLALLQGRGI